MKIVMLGGAFVGVLHAQDQTQTPPRPPGTPPAATQSQPEPAPPSSQPPPPQAQSTPAPPPQTPSPETPSDAKPERKKSRSKSAPGHKVVVRNGGVRDVAPQLAPGMSKEQEIHSRATTTQLLETTDANLKTMSGRQLSPAQQSLLDQIHSYVKQSKDASSAGDLDRAHTLAYKAHLLSDELRK